MYTQYAAYTDSAIPEKHFFFFLNHQCFWFGYLKKTNGWLADGKEFIIAFTLSSEFVLII